MYSVYVIRNPQGRFYTGYTRDLQKRINQHNAIDGFRSYTSGRGPWELVYSETFPSELEAKAREKYLKTGTGRDYLQGRLSASADG